MKNRKTQKRPFSLRIPAELLERIDQCAQQLRLAGLAVNRTDVARLLISRALDTFRCDASALLSPRSAG